MAEILLQKKEQKESMDFVKFINQLTEEQKKSLHYMLIGFQLGINTNKDTNIGQDVSHRM